MPYRPTVKTEARKAAMRGRLMAAATRLFAEQGYEPTTLQQIVKEAGTSIGNCYFYFANKEALLLAIAEELRQEIAEKIDRAIAPFPLGPGLLAVAVYAGTLAALERAEVARFALSDSTHLSLRPLTMELFAGRVESAFRAMPTLFADWPDANPKMAAAAWHGAAYYVLEGAIQNRENPEPHRVARFLTRWNLQALGLPQTAVQEGMKTLDAYAVAHNARSAS
jgi:AcrR family transcriptional regulator